MIWNLLAGIWVTAAIAVPFFVPGVQDLKATPIAFFHVPMAISTLACFFIAAFFGAKWLFQRDERADALSLGFGEIGFVAGCITFATGLLFARVNWNGFWTGDPQQVGTLGALMIYAALLTLRNSTDDEVKRRNFWAVYAIFGALVALFGMYIYSRIVPANTSLHPNETLQNSSAIYKWAFRFCILATLFALCRVAILRARLEIFAVKLRESAF